MCVRLDCIFKNIHQKLNWRLALVEGRATMRSTGAEQRIGRCTTVAGPMTRRLLHWITGTLSTPHMRSMLVVAAVVVSCLVAYQVGSRENSTEPEPELEIEGLTVSPSALDIGEVWEAKEFLWTLPVRNRTREAIQVHDFAVSCACIDFETHSFRIQPGETVNVHLKWDLTKRLNYHIGMERRQFRQAVWPIVKGRAPPAWGWELHGEILSRITLELDAVGLHFGEKPVHDQAPVTRKVLVSAHVPVDRLDVRAEPALGTTRVVRRHDDEKQFELFVTPHPNLSPGPFRFDLHINLVTPTGDYLPGAILPVAGDMQHEVRPLPSRVLLGSRRVGETAQATVVFQAPSDSGWAIDHIETDSAELQVEAIKADATTPRHAFRVNQQISKEGNLQSACQPDRKVRQGPPETLGRPACTFPKLCPQLCPSPGRAAQM